jgi:hypothetical protein
MFHVFSFIATTKTMMGDSQNELGLRPQVPTNLRVLSFIQAKLGRSVRHCRLIFSRRLCGRCDRQRREIAKHEAVNVRWKGPNDAIPAVLRDDASDGIRNADRQALHVRRETLDNDAIPGDIANVAI